MRKLLMLICLFLLTGCTGQSAAETQAVEVEMKDPSELKATHHAVITVPDYGEIYLDLDRDAAPITVDNFIKLVEEGYYDGTTFHRIIEGFVLQGGDPTRTGGGGAEERIKGEFASNGYANPIKHVAGVISMARQYYPDTASSQYFILLGDAPHLDGNYAAFGWVSDEKSLEVCQAIAADAEPIDGNGKIFEDDQTVVESIRMLDD